MNWLREIWRSRPPVSPWWMYEWLEGWGQHPHSVWNSYPRWRKIAHSLSCWWLLWRWAASPAGYGGDYTDVQFGVSASRPLGESPQC